MAAVLDGPAGTLASVWSGGHLNAPVPATQLRVLFVVERYGSINVTGVATELGALLSSASRLCGRLEATGLLERVPGPDRRAITLRLTPRGADLLADLRRVRRGALAEVLAGMDTDDRAALRLGLERFHEAVVRQRGEAPLGFSMPA
ncbi:DNA-binding MarR family transcriptional regulator [Actinomadura namibiensis]|uniref:DNA-binding MarR family transcriptional regulator n=1 Tax=Actinomadura namibiensis TaxID=182080 RepID=A0A7W3QIZ8_ACTNM|nr:MarR family transcriptional regulator [Actinomadura namibiensis]MBA8948747.1 DNA-binding MarR family transcriptional regulator [Actinomadura namibiensis]